MNGAPCEARDPEGWVLEFRMYHGSGSALECSGVYACVKMASIIRQSMTQAEARAIVNDGAWHHTSRACSGVEYRLWRVGEHEIAPTQLGLFAEAAA